MYLRDLYGTTWGIYVFWNKSLLTIKCEEPFNAECILYYSSKIQGYVLNRECEDWLRLEILDGNSLVSPDGLDISRDLVN